MGGRTFSEHALLKHSQSQHISYFRRRGFIEIGVFEPEWGDRSCNNEKYVEHMVHYFIISTFLC